MLLLALTLGTGGCGRIRQDRQADALEASLEAYGQAIRWGYYQAAIGFVPVEKRADIDPQYLDNIRVTGYEVMQPAILNEEDKSAVQIVRVEYVLKDRQSVRVLSDRQQWRFDTDTKAWWLDSGLPAFGDRPSGDGH